jgi:glutathione S-transferase
MARPIVYGPANSTYVWSTRLALAEKGVAHELVDVPVGALREEPHLSRHPFAKLPAFEHDGFSLYETQAILRYIDEGFPVSPLQPTDLHQFARMNQIMGIVDAYAWRAIAAGIVFNRLLAPRLGLPVDEAAVARALPQTRRPVDGRPVLYGRRADQPGRSDGRPAIVLSGPRAGGRGAACRAPDAARLDEADRGPAELPGHEAARAVRANR